MIVLRQFLRGPDPLLAPEVVCAHDDRVRLRRFQQALVSLLLLFDARGRRGSREVQELRAEQAHTLRMAPFERRDLLGQFEVGPQHDPDPVGRRRRSRRPCPQPPVFLPGLAHPEETLPDPLPGRRGLDDPAVAIHDDRTLRRDRLAEPCDTGHRREAEGAGDDARVGRWPASFQGDRPHAARVQARRVRRRELVGHEDGSARQIAAGQRLAAGQVAGDLPGHIRDIGGALPHRRGIGGFEPPAHLAGDRGEGPFGVDALLAHPLDDRRE